MAAPTPRREPAATTAAAAQYLARWPWFQALSAALQALVLESSTYK